MINDICTCKLCMPRKVAVPRPDRPPTLEEAFLEGWHAARSGLSVEDAVRYDALLGLDHVAMAEAVCSRTERVR